jgi:calcineurin-like phosphoesterase family protein
MNKEMVSRHNSVVKPTDTVFLLGDLGWPDPTEWVKQLNGVKLLIKGNHDDQNLITALRRDNVVGSVSDYFELPMKEHGLAPIVMSHYPIESWNRKYHGSIHLHGHTHGTLDNSGLLRFDMGVDCNDLKPFSLRQVLGMYGARLKEIGGLEGVRGNLGDKETFGLRDTVKHKVRDARMQELYNEAEADFDKFLAEHLRLQKTVEYFEDQLRNPTHQDE